MESFYLNTTQSPYSDYLVNPSVHESEHRRGSESLLTETVDATLKNTKRHNKQANGVRMQMKVETNSNIPNEWKEPSTLCRDTAFCRQGIVSTFIYVFEKLKSFG